MLRQRRNDMPKHLFQEGEKNLAKRPDIRKKISMAKMGHLVSEETKAKISKKNAGKVLTEEHKAKMSKALRGRKKPPRTQEHKMKLGEARKGKPSWNKGKKMPASMIEKMRIIASKRVREKSTRWKGGITPEYIKIRQSVESRLWRESIFARDNWACQKCIARGKRLNPHHIQNFSQWPELRFAIDNGITFCEECHKIFHKLYGKQNNTKEQLETFLKINGNH